MTTQTLNTLYCVTTWSGVSITLSGILINFANGGNWEANALSLFGLFITCAGHVVTNSLKRRQLAEAESGEAVIEDLSLRLYSAEEVVNDPDFKRLVKMESDRYAIAHQDDG